MNDGGDLHTMPPGRRQDTVTREDSDRPSVPPGEQYTRRIQRDESASIAVIRTIAVLSNTPVDEIDPLADWFDPDALDALVASGEDVTVQFEYVGATVIVDSETVTVRDPDET